MSASKTDGSPGGINIPEKDALLLRAVLANVKGGFDVRDASKGRQIDWTGVIADTEYIKAPSAQKQWGRLRARLGIATGDSPGKTTAKVDSPVKKRALVTNATRKRKANEDQDAADNGNTTPNPNPKTTKKAKPTKPKNGFRASDMNDDDEEAVKGEPEEASA